MTKPKCLCGLDLIELKGGFTACPSEDRLQPQETETPRKERVMSAWDIAHNKAFKSNVKEWYK